MPIEWISCDAEEIEERSRHSRDGLHSRARNLALRAIVFAMTSLIAASGAAKFSLAQTEPQLESASARAQSTEPRQLVSGENPLKMSKVRLEGTYFSRNGRRFIPAGAHWIPAQAGLEWPTAWTPKEIEADFAKMRELGFNTVRFDLFWAWFEPRPGDYNPEAFRQLDFLVGLAHRYRIYLHPTLFVGWEVGEAFWDIPWRHGRHPHADPEMLRLQTNHAAELARYQATIRTHPLVQAEMTVAAGDGLALAVLARR